MITEINATVAEGGVVCTLCGLQTPAIFTKAECLSVGRSIQRSNAMITGYLILVCRILNIVAVIE